MDATLPVDPSASSRDLIRRMRAETRRDDHDVMPESIAWQAYIELHRRGEPRAARLFISALRHLHTRRSVAGVALAAEDVLPDEHRLTDDPFLGELWKAYKKCICAGRTGPAAQLLRDLEEQVG